MLLLLLPAQADDYASVLQTIASSAADEYQLGKEYIESRSWLFGADTDPAKVARVEGIARRLVAASDRPDLVYTVRVLKDESVNAMAFPGGFLLINSGLLRVQDDDQLAFVMGHELAHAILRHGVNKINMREAADTAASLSSARSSADRTAVLAQTDTLQIMFAQHSQQLELEADLYGLLYAARAGFPAEGGRRALESLRADLGDIDPVHRARASHPDFTTRLQQLTLAEAGFRRTLARFDAGVSMLQSGDHGAAITAFQEFLTVFPKSHAGWANLGCAHLTDAQKVQPGPWADVLPIHTSPGVTLRGDATLAHQRARDALAHAHRLDPSDPVTLGLLGILARREGQLPQARELLTRAVGLSPDSAALRVDLANVAAAEGRNDEALAAWTKDKELAEARVNAARLHETLKKKKEAIEAWKSVADVPAWRKEASARLTALGATPPAAPPLIRAGGSLGTGALTVSLGATAADLEALLGTPDETIPLGDRIYQTWGEKSLAVLFRADKAIQIVADGPEWKTSEGLGTGATEAAARTVYAEPSETWAVGASKRLRWTGSSVEAGIYDGFVVYVALGAAS